jgi:branched-chain amino acid transport system substrate-binding protein
MQFRGNNVRTAERRSLGRPLRRSLLAVAVAAALATSACSESTQTGTTGAPTTTVAPAVADCEAAASVVDCAPAGSMLDDLLPEEPTKATGTPILIGTINQDTGAAGAFPELTDSLKTAFDFINTELNGVDGHPLELVTCNTNFNPDLSQSCAQEMVSRNVSAVIGGIDIWGTGITTLENNGIPYVGGIPVSFESVRSPVSFQFSGGTWGAVLGMGQYAVEDLEAKKIALIAAEFGPITDSAELGKAAMEKHGASVTLVKIPAINADMVQALNTAAQAEPDVVIALTADSGCKPTMLTAEQLDLGVPVMYTGACAAPKIIDSVGDAANGAVFNLEADLDAESADTVIYRAASERYGPKYDYEWQGAGTVSFRAAINLYAVLRELGADNITREAILDAFRSARDESSFFGHPYTCDGEQLDGYPAMCAPQQTLGTLQDGVISPVTGWIDVRAFAS